MPEENSLQLHYSVHSLSHSAEAFECSSLRTARPRLRLRFVAAPSSRHWPPLPAMIATAYHQHSSCSNVSRQLQLAFLPPLPYPRILASCLRTIAAAPPKPALGSRFASFDTSRRIFANLRVESTSAYRSPNLFSLSLYLVRRMTRPKRTRLRWLT